MFRFDILNECKVVQFQLHILIQLFPLYSGETSPTVPYQTESQSSDPLQHFLNSFSPTDNEESAPTLNTKSLFGSKTVKEKSPCSYLELLKHLKPSKTIENKTKSSEWMKYLRPIRQDTREFSLPD